MKFLFAILTFILLPVIIGLPAWRLPGGGHLTSYADQEDQELKEIIEEMNKERERELDNQLRKLFKVRDAGNFFSRWNCEWIEYLETCDYKEDCSGHFKSQKTSWSLEWTSCNDTIINEIRKIFPDTYLRFDEESVWRRRCIPKEWSGVEFCGPIKEKSARLNVNEFQEES